jgi:hypothetical protein
LPAATGGAVAAGGVAATGGRAAATGGVTMVAGGATATGGALATGGAAAGTGGSTGASNSSCDFTQTACTALPGCDSFTSASEAWKVAPCKALLQCLETNSSCIKATDLFCGPVSTSSTYTPPVCDPAYNNIIGEKAVTDLLTAIIKCACGL